MNHLFKKCILALTLTICVCKSFGANNDLSGQWDLKIEDKSHHTIATYVIEFSQQKAESCIVGNWLRVNVVSSKVEDSLEPLSYQISDNKLMIGRNNVCDAYLRLEGDLNNQNIQGEYYRFGWTSKSLGFFTLSKKK